IAPDFSASKQTCVPARPRRRSTWRWARLSRSWANISASRRLSSKFLEPTTTRSAAWRGRARRRSAPRAEVHRSHAAPKALITPALFSPPPPRPPGEEGEISFFSPLSPGGWGGGGGRGGWGGEGLPTPQLQQRRHIRVRRLLLQLLWDPELQEASTAHDADAVGQSEGLAEVVGHQHGGLGEAAFQLQELAVELQAGQGVEGAEGLVEQDQRRIGGEGAGEGDPLALASGELGGIAAALSRGEPDQLQHLARPLLATVAVPAEETGDQLDVALDAPVGDQAAVLRHVADAATEGDGIEVRRGLSLDPHGAGGGLDHPVEGAEKSGLPRAALAHQGHRLPGIHRQGHSGEGGRAVAVGLGDLERLQDGLSVHAGSISREGATIAAS